MKSDIIIIGGGAAGLMAAYSAAETLVKSGSPASVTVLEKMPRPARKVMITGKGRCNFSNIKPWNDFCTHIRSKADFLKPAFYNFSSEDCLHFFESQGMPSVVERGDRAFPVSHLASDVVDTLVRACHGVGVKIVTEAPVAGIDCCGGAPLQGASPLILSSREGSSPAAFSVRLEDGREWTCSKLIIACGGLSYPGTGSTGDGYRIATGLGHSLTPLFPSLTALVPTGYKISVEEDEIRQEGCQKAIHRDTPLASLGEKLKGVQLKNVAARLFIEGTLAQGEFGDIDFTDGGIEGPLGFQLSRKAVKAMVNGSKVVLSLDLKPAVPQEELSARVKELWTEVDRDPRSRRLREKEKCRILLGKLMPWELIPGFVEANPGIITLERRGRADTKVWVNLPTIAKSLKDWRFAIDGYVGYERCVVTAGGVSLDEVLRKTMESRLVPGLYFCGEVLDVDADTGGYNLQCAFSTGRLAGQSAAASI